MPVEEIKQNSYDGKRRSLVFVDDQAYGPVSVRSIPTTQISEIRVYRAWESLGKYGSGLPGGAIAIYTRLEP